MRYHVAGSPPAGADHTKGIVVVVESPSWCRFRGVLGAAAYAADILKTEDTNTASISIVKIRFNTFWKEILHNKSYRVELNIKKSKIKVFSSSKWTYVTIYFTVTDFADI